jgi:hypothetical protein
VAASPLDAYFAALDAGDDEAAAAAFAEDAVYIRPALTETGATGNLEVIRGRDRILEFLAQRRKRVTAGQYAHRHEVRAAAIDGHRCFVEALMVTDASPVGVFLAHATFDGEMRISRYIAVMARTEGELDPPG